MLTREHVLEVLTYDPETGIFVRIDTGEVAGYIHHHTGYRQIGIDGCKYRASHLAWFIMTGAWPKQQINHRDTNRSNDSFHNLREASNSENGANKPAYRNNTSGFKGVHQFRVKGVLTNKWRAQIRKSGRVFHLGLFPSPEDAAFAYASAAHNLYGEFARWDNPSPPGST